MEKCPHSYKSIDAELLRRAAKGIFGIKRELNIGKLITEERKKSLNLNIICKTYELDNNKIEFAKLNIFDNLDCLLLSIGKVENNIPIKRELMVCKESAQDLYRIIVAYECDTCKQVLGEREAYLIFDIKKDNPINIVKIVPDHYKGRALVESAKLKFSDKSKIFPHLIGGRLFESMNNMGESILFFEPVNIKVILNMIQRLNDRLRSFLLEFHSECEKIKDKKICYFAEDVLKDYTFSYHSFYRYMRDFL